MSLFVRLAMHTDEQIKKVISDGTFIFNEVFKKSISDEVFFHKHFDNPNIIEPPYIIEYSEDKPVAMRWMMGMSMLYNGHQLNAVQSSDDASLPEARGLTFLKIRKASEKLMRVSGTDFIYGCFYPGNAMDIAQKLGEKNFVTLYAAKLPLNDTVYAWKRFRIPIPECFVKANAANLIKKLQALSEPCTYNIEISKSCPFSEKDFLLINTDNSLKVGRTQSYYDWKLSSQKKKDVKFITARKKGNLVGFMVVVSDINRDIIADWDIFASGDEQTKILAALVLKASGKKTIIAPSLNPESHELKLFTDIGFSDERLHEAPICICAKAFNQETADIISKPEVWKHRFIDVDYFLN